MACSSVKICAALFSLVSALVLGACAGDSASSIPPRARWHNNQGVVYMDQHNYTRGREEFARAIDLAPGYARGHANLGIAYYSLGKYDSAAVALQQALERDPELLQARYTLGLIYNAQGREHEKALQALESVARVDPDDPQVRYYLGQVKTKLGDSEGAMEEFRRAIRLDPYNVSAYYGLANQLRRLDRQQEWKEALEKFNALSQAGHQGVSSSYQGQGKYAEAIADDEGARPQVDDARGPFRFAAATALSEHPAPLRYAALVDRDGDGDLDLLLGGASARLMRNDDGAFAPLAAPDLPQETTHALFGDADNDGDPDLVVATGASLLLYRADGEGWKAPETLPGAASGAVYADADHDGDLDLMAWGANGARLLANDGQATFADIGEGAGLALGEPVVRALFTDFDNDRDVDFFLLGPGALRLYTNNRDGTFAEIAARVGLEGITGTDLAVEDFDQDTYMDLAVLGEEGRVQLYRNARGRAFAAGTSAQVEGAPFVGIQPADLENDGDLDLVVWGAGGVRLLAYHDGTFHPQAEPLLSGEAVAHLLAADLDGDGRTDILADERLAGNRGAGGHWVEVLSRGLNSNKDGVGTKVEVKTANRQQKREVRGGSRDAQPLLFGLAQSDSVEFVRLLWPGGVRQTELATAAGQRLELTELDRKGTSCPILYVWDGERFRFVSDILGGAIIGYLVGPGQYYPSDTDEYVRLGPIAPRDGRYVVQLANQLEEVLYFDAVELVAVDHPAGLDIYPNERLLSAPPYPEFRLYPLKDLRPPRAATDHRGRDVLEVLSRADDEWYDGFSRLDIHGYAEEFSLTLDLGDLSESAHPVLLAYGWVDYAHSTSNWAAGQRGLSLAPPRLEVADGRGGWLQVSADMGTPAGLPKHMLYDLKGLFPGTEYRLRITTSAALYWDQFLVGEAAAASVQIHRLPPAAADLHWRGYPEHTSIKGTFAFRYDYDRLHLEAPWGTHAGAFTRFGPVGALLDSVDDRYVITLHGDELSVEFNADLLPALPPGMERSFLLYADGFGKDMDYHSAHSLTVEPLPFHGMSSYPYPPGETYPQTRAHLDYVQEYNTRVLRGYYE